MILDRVADAADLRLARETGLSNADALGQEITELSDELVNGQGDDDVLAAYDDAFASLETQLLQLEQARKQLFALATEGLVPEKTSRLVFWRATSQFRVPAEFRVLDRDEAEWAAIERAVSAENSAMRRGESVPAEHAALLNELRTGVEVGEASVRLDMHLPAIQDLFHAHGSPP